MFEEQSCESVVTLEIDYDIKDYDIGETSKRVKAEQ